MKRGLSVFAAGTMFLALAVGFAWPAGAGNFSYHKDFTRTVPVSGQREVRVENVNGRLEISGWDRKEIEIKGTKFTRDAEDLERVDVEVTTASDHIGIKVRVPKVRRWFFFKIHKAARVDLSVRVPRAMFVKAASVNGKVLLTGLSAGGQGSSVNGSVRAEEVAGRWKMNNVNGGIAVEQSQGCVSAKTVNGGIQVRLKAVKDCSEMDFETVNGTIELEVDPAVLDTVKAGTVNGSIRFDIPIRRFESESRRKKVAVVGKGPLVVHLATINGSIRVSKPSPIGR